MLGADIGKTLLHLFCVVEGDWEGLSARCQKRNRRRLLNSRRRERRASPSQLRLWQEGAAGSVLCLEAHTDFSFRYRQLREIQYVL